VTHVVGLDLSLNGTGYACPQCGTGVVRVGKRIDVERLDWVEANVMTHAMPGGGHEKADVAAIEQYAFSPKGRAHAHPVGELGGVVRLALYRVLVPMAFVPVGSLKKFATGKGNADKDEVLAAVIRNWTEFAGTTNDEADAFILRQMALAFYDGGVELNKKQQEAIDTVEWPALEGLT
jgi:crossover junction endodeoxyribonuclease RuvC